MKISDVLLPEFGSEMKNTRKLLERVPEDKPDYKPHGKSMALGRLAAHIAQLPEFAIQIVELPSLDFSNGKMKPLVMESREQLLAAFDSLAERLRKAIENMTDEKWEQTWKLSFEGKTIADAPRFFMYRNMFLNHLIHHRAQLGVYLRLNDVPLPATYGPSADDKMGF